MVSIASSMQWPPGTRMTTGRRLASRRAWESGAHPDDMYTYIYIYIHMYVCVYIYIYIYE